MEFNYETLRNYVDNYITSLKTERNLSPKSTKAYYSDLSGLLTWLSQNQHTQIDNDILNNYIECLQSERNLKDSSIKRKYVTLKSFFNFLAFKKTIPSSPLNNVRKSFKTCKCLPKTLSNHDIISLLKSPVEELKTLGSEYRKNICIRNIAITELLYWRNWAEQRCFANIKNR